MGITDLRLIGFLKGQIHQRKNVFDDGVCFLEVLCGCLLIRDQGDLLRCINGKILKYFLSFHPPDFRSSLGRPAQRQALAAV